MLLQKQKSKQTLKTGKKNKRDFIFAGLLKTLIIALTIAAFCEKLILGTPSDEMIKTLIMFTNGSVLYVAISAVISLVYMNLAYAGKIEEIPNGVKLFEFGSVIAITLTCLGYILGGIVVFISGVDQTAIQTIGCFHNIGRHLLIPVIAVGNFFGFSHDVKLNNKNVYVVLIFPIVWLIGQIIVFYTTGIYPYFCLNYGSRVGGFFFNFKFYSQEDMAYFMGSFYGILLAAGVVIGGGGAYKALIGIRHKRVLKLGKIK